MALGKKLFEISDKEIIAGMSSSDDLADGGFSPLTDAINLLAEPGVIYQPAQPTDKSTNVVGNIIASCPDPQFGGSQRVFIDDAGHYYTSNSVGNMTLAQTDSSGNTYGAAFTHASAFGGSIFATSEQNAIRYSTSGPIFTTNYATFTNQNVMHPNIVYIDFLYYGDKNLLLRQASDSTSPATILTLTPEQNIIALGIDPGSGLLLISTTTQLNASDTVPTVNKVHYYDGSSAQPQKTIIVDDMVTAFYPVGGNIYVTYANNLGYWSGAGIQFLRKLNNIPYSNFGPTTLPYRQHLTNIESTLYVIDGNQILAHGPVRQNGNKVFYYAFKNQTSGNNILYHICNFGSGLLAMSFLTNKFYTWDTMNTASSNTQMFESNSVDFDDEMWIRRCRIVWRNQVTNNASPGSIRFKDQDGIVSNFGNGGLVVMRNVSGAPSAFFDVLNIDIKVKQVQIEMLLDTLNPGIRRIILYGDPANITQ